jgi:hypothetical protein
LETRCSGYKRLETAFLAAHNRLVAGSSPAGPTTPPTRLGTRPRDQFAAAADRRGPVLNFPAARKLVATPPGPTI